LLALLTAPFYRIRTSTAPTRLFLLFAINKKRELKPISIPLWQIFTWYGVEPLFTNYFLLLNQFVYEKEYCTGSALAFCRRL
jgi:hypothetical protein